MAWESGNHHTEAGFFRTSACSLQLHLLLKGLQGLCRGYITGVYRAFYKIRGTFKGVYSGYVGRIRDNGKEHGNYNLPFIGSAGCVYIYI